MRIHTSLTSLVLLGTSLVATACMNRGDGGGDSASTDSAESAVDSTDSTQAEGDMMMSSMDGADMQGLTAATGVDVAVRVAANVELRWNPSGCATVTHDGANVAIQYNDCTGPRGLVHVTGELDLAISVSLAGAISVHATSQDLQVNRADLVIDATADYRVDGTSHELAVTSHGSGTGARGTSIDHDGAYTIAWDPATQCRSIDGAWSTDFTKGSASADRSTQVNLSRCGAACPTGTVSHDFLGGASMLVTFDGTAIATWSASTGASGTVNLTCGQ